MAAEKPGGKVELAVEEVCEPVEDDRAEGDVADEGDRVMPADRGGGPTLIGGGTALSNAARSEMLPVEGVCRCDFGTTSAPS